MKDRNNLLCLAKRADIAQLLSTDGAGGLGLRARLVLFLSKLNGSRAAYVTPQGDPIRRGQEVGGSGLYLRMAGLCSGDPMVRSCFLYSTDGSHGISIFIPLLRLLRESLVGLTGSQPESSGLKRTCSVQHLPDLRWYVAAGLEERKGGERGAVPLSWRSEDELMLQRGVLGPCTCSLSVWQGLST